MSAPRLATIPFEHVEAELAAFPLASEASFRLGTAFLDPIVSRKADLWRAAERDILSTLPSVPPDEAVAIRDELWFNSSNSDHPMDAPVPLVEYIRRLARSYLDSSGRPVGIVESEAETRRTSAPEARLRWSWMCRALPPDLLRVARNIVDADEDPFPLSPFVEQVLRDRGFAETHLHLGGSPDFSLAWAALMQGLTDNESKHSDFESPGACFEHGRNLCLWILYAAVVRLVLADWLYHATSLSASSNKLLEFASSRPGRKFTVLEHNRLANLLFEFRRGRWIESHQAHRFGNTQESLSKRFAQTRSLYIRLIGPPDLIRNRDVERDALRRRNAQTRQDVYLNDPLARVVGWHPTEAVSPETLFVAKALQRIEYDLEHDNNESDFASLFWQMMRIRCLLYRHVVQRPLTPGLQWFVRFFARIKPLRKNISEMVLASTAARSSGKVVGLRSLEVRLGTEESVSDCMKKVRDLEMATHPKGTYAEWRSTRLLTEETTEGLVREKAEAMKFEVGALFHFSRKRGGGWERGSLNAYGLDHSYPGMPPTSSKRLIDAGNPSGFRFARFYMRQRRHAQALVSVFQKYPRALRTVRGIDLCTDEAGVPVWVMAPLVHWVRQAGRQAAVQLKRRGEFRIPALRASVHAGEDFVHLLTGLRRLDEAVTYLRLEEGDRLGHALSLGVDPSVWSDRIGRVVQTREERLFDLTWEWRSYADYSEHGVGAASERLAYLRTEIVRLARLIFDRSCVPEDLMDFIDLLHNEKHLSAAGFPDQPTRLAGDLRQPERPPNETHTQRSQALLRAYLGEEKTWRQGRVPETTDLRKVRHEQAALSQLQDGLRRKVGKLSLTIEVNPSSNLLIGDLGNFVGHPLWRLRPVVPEGDVSPLSVCIGSDDPLTFATTLPHEYQLLFDALILMGRSHDEAMKWIDDARNAGMQSRFTLPPDLEQISKGLRVPNLLGWDRPESPP